MKSLTFSPTQPQQPQTSQINACFGKLPKLEFLNKIDYPSEANFTIDNIEGKPTTASESAQIYYLKNNLTRFGYISKITQMAKVVGFDPELTSYNLEGNIAYFEDQTGKFEVDIADFNFKYEYNWKNEPDLINTSNVSDENTILENAKQFLRVMGTYPEELAQGRTNIIYLRFDPLNQEFEVVEDPDQANAAEVDFFRPDLDQFPAVSPNYYNSQNYVTLIFQQGRSKVIRAQISFWEKVESESCYYPIKTGEEAWNDLQQKRGAIVSAGSGTTDIVIKKMFLGYYDPGQYQEYLQPVYVFLGDEGFVGYVPAVREGYAE